MRFASVRLVVVRLFAAAVVLTAAPVVAQEAAPAAAPLESRISFDLAAPADEVAAPQQRVVLSEWQFTEPRRTRPAALKPLYASLVALNVLDVHSTYAALRGGNAREANPLMAKVVDRPATFIAAKAGTTALSIWAAEKLWKKNRVAAVIVVGAANVALAAAVANNYKVSRRPDL